MAIVLSPPPTGNDPVLYRWLYDLWRKLGESSNEAPIDISGSAADATTITTTLPIDKGGTGATDAASAVANLGVQTIIDPASAGDVPVSDGSQFITRQLNVDDVNGAFDSSLIQTQRGVALNAASGALVGDFGDTTVTWDTPFFDANYTLTIAVTPTVGVPIASIVSKAAASCVIRITNATAAMSDGTADVTAVHD